MPIARTIISVTSPFDNVKNAHRKVAHCGKEEPAAEIKPPRQASSPTLVDKGYRHGADRERP